MFSCRHRVPSPDRGLSGSRRRANRLPSPRRARPGRPVAAFHQDKEERSRPQFRDRQIQIPGRRGQHPSVPTHYIVRGSTLIQVVEHRTSSVAYPVTADPWWGLQFKITSTTANKLVAIFGSGAAAATIVAAVCTGLIVGIPCGAAAAVVAGLLAGGAAVLAYCNAGGRGLYINESWNGWVWCTGV